ncbi:hypothetical protein ABIF26_009581 [Bradyrhizobium elkanii]
MHGAVAMKQEIKRVEVGPTKERLAKAQNHYTVGDDKQGTRLYHFQDTTVDRMYSRLTRQAKSRATEEGLRSEYIALQRYKHHWHHSGLELALASVDPNRIFASDPAGMSGMPKSEKQAHHRRQYREARDLLGWKPHIVLENIVCAEVSLQIAGFSIGYNSPFRAREGAEKMLRESARKLAKHWGIS